MHCRQRTCSLTRGNAGHDELVVNNAEDRMARIWERVKVFLNGDIRVPQPHHFCNGCCESEQAVLDNCFAASVEASLVLDSVVAKVPSKNRWGAHVHLPWSVP